MIEEDACAFTLQDVMARAKASGVEISDRDGDALLAHARLVLEHNANLHLTSITGKEAFLERHFRESFEGAAMLPAAIEGTLLDLGSGNGYPGIPLAISRRGLAPVLAESSQKKAVFLRGALQIAELTSGRVLEKHVERAADLAELGPIAVIASRAMGGWERIVPKLTKSLQPGGLVLLWMGAEAIRVTQRASWMHLSAAGLRRFPGSRSSVVVALKLS